MNLIFFLSQLLFEERSRWILWWPVGMGGGISLYFSLFDEPSWTLSLLLICLSMILTIGACTYGQKHFFWGVCAFVCMSVSLGFGAAKLRTETLSTPLLKGKIENSVLTALFLDHEVHPKRHRLILGDIAFNADDDVGPCLKNLRLNMPLSNPLKATIGDRIRLTADILPLSDPVSLSGYNFRRQAYFQGISAVGRVKGAVEVIEEPQKSMWLSRVRHDLTLTLQQRLPGQAGAIAAALITGDRSGILPEVRQAFTDAGLAHILAISGLHLSLVAGLVFLVFRRGLALCPFFAEKYPIKKWTAVMVMMATLAYLALSGFGIPAQRSFVMIFVVMVGIMLDRNPISMRLVAVAATLILLVRPESLLSASFQLSFAAVIGLIAAYEGGWQPLRSWSYEGGYHRRLIAYGLGLMATTLVATLATTPYTVAIFNRFTLQAIVGNFLAIPLTSLMIMPAAMASVLTLPFGGLDVAFIVLGFGVSHLIAIAQMVSAWPGAAILVPTPPPIFLALMTLGGVWICFWRRPWRWLGLAPCGLACLVPLFHSPATIYVAGEGGVMAYREKDNLFVSHIHRGGFYTDQWMKELGLLEKREWAEDPLKLQNHDVWLIGMPNPPDHLIRRACAAKVLVTTGYAWRKCQRLGVYPKVLIDRYDLKKEGTHQIWVRNDGVEVKSVREHLARRPWNRG